MKHQFVAGIAMATASVVLWGVQFPVAKDLFAAMHPVVLAALRVGIGALAMVPLLLLAEGRAAFSYHGGAGRIGAMGVAGTCASPMLIFIGISYSRPEHAAVLVALQASMAALTQWLAQDRRPANFTLGCIVVAFAGVVMLVTKGAALSFSGRELAGDFLILLGVIAGLVYNLGAERFPGWSPLRFTTMTLIPGAIAGVLIVLAGTAAGWVPLPDLASLGAAWIGVAYISLGGVVVAMSLWIAGIQRIGALNAMLLISLTPVVTFSVRYFQGETYVPVELAGGAVVVGALIANNMYLRRQFARKAARV